jgi:hypothetical protein
MINNFLVGKREIAALLIFLACLMFMLPSER